MSPVTGAVDVVAVGFGDAGGDEVCALEPLAVLRDLAHEEAKVGGLCGSGRRPWDLYQMRK